MCLSRSCECQPATTRRHFVRHALAAAATVGVAGPAFALPRARPADRHLGDATAPGRPSAEHLAAAPRGHEGAAGGVPSPATPAEALQALYAGNARFAAGRPIAPHRDLERLKAVAPRQAPFAAFLGCADSRVPIEILFDQGFGDLFVTRIAGNIAVAENIGSLEFGTAVLGAKVLFVLGHTRCGAVAETMKGDEVPGQISSLYFHIRPAVQRANGNLDRAIVENVRQQAVGLRDGSTVLRRLVARGQLIVAGGVYDLETGRVNPVPLD